ncbi:hypothetical protein DDZ13_11920 [Coraliomargarita sinensis]|uniref:Uncharacterized protein n=1 Tax=Coraliomargarita sinensis TaxID=2174842 RepID=A0A317ZDS5_9BACT|nr:hypothetical protein DDZ13_11920 [Coraliomargarita sinensis]
MANSFQVGDISVAGLTVTPGTNLAFVVFCFRSLFPVGQMVGPAFDPVAFQFFKEDTLDGFHFWFAALLANEEDGATMVDFDEVLYGFPDRRWSPLVQGRRED